MTLVLEVGRCWGWEKASPETRGKFLDLLRENVGEEHRNISKYSSGMVLVRLEEVQGGKKSLETWFECVLTVYKYLKRLEATFYTFYIDHLGNRIRN